MARSGMLTTNDRAPLLTLPTRRSNLRVFITPTFNRCLLARTYEKALASPSANNMTLDESIKLVEKAAAELGEHFDAVEILVSHPAADGGGWECVKRGAGNYYARLSMAQEFIDQDKADTMAKALKDRE